jgi:hypothetical protein
VRSVAPNGDALTYRPPERPGIPQLLVIAGWAGLRIHEEAVDWVGDHDSRVDILATALADLRGIARIGRDLVRGTLPTAGLRRSADAPRDGLTGQLLRFGAAGAVSTVGYVLLYAVLRPVAGPQAANALALPVRGRQHGREPAAHLRAARPWRRAAPPGQGPTGLFGRLGPHQRLTHRTAPPGAQRRACTHPSSCPSSRPHSPPLSPTVPAAPVVLVPDFFMSRRSRSEGASDIRARPDPTRAFPLRDPDSQPAHDEGRRTETPSAAPLTGSTHPVSAP